MNTDTGKPAAKGYSNVIDLPQTAEDTNLLGGIVDKHAEALAELIERAQTPFTIAIQGEWGSGKTSLMRKICHKLCGDSKPGEAFIKDESGKKDFCGVWLDTWEYSLMRSPNEVYLQVITSIAEAVDNFVGETSTKKSADSGIKTSQNNDAEDIKDELRGLTGFVKNRIAPWLSITPSVSLQAIGAALTSGGVLLENALSRESRNNDGSRENTRTIKEFRKELGDAIQKLQNQESGSNAYKGILFFIDDLDRIEPTVAVQVLEILKNLFEEDGCIFVLAIDYNVVVKGLKNKFGDYDVKNDHEFRRFFDKIIQLPFNMPVPSYQIADFLASTLENIGYYDGSDSKSGLESALGDAADKKLKAIRSISDAAAPKLLVKNLLEQMARLSTGQNPRAVKRLINSLSLINIMHKRTLTPAQRQICFGMVCMQVAYTGIYNMLIEEPDFTKWGKDENKARNLRWLPQGETLESVPQEEKWKKIVYYASQGNVWLRERTMNIVNLLELMAACVPQGKDLEKEFRKVINFTAVTSAGSARSAVHDDISMSLEDLLEHLEYYSSIPQETRALLARFMQHLHALFNIGKENALVDVEYAPTEIKATVLHYENNNTLLRISLNDQPLCYAVPPVDGPFGSMPLTSEAEADGSFCKKLREGYNMLADEGHKLKCIKNLSS